MDVTKVAKNAPPGVLILYAG